MTSSHAHRPQGESQPRARTTPAARRRRRGRPRAESGPRTATTTRLATIRPSSLVPARQPVQPRVARLVEPEQLGAHGARPVVRDDLVRVAVELHPAVAHEQHPVAARGEVEVVGDQDELLRQAEQQVADPAAVAEVEQRRRLVGHEHGRARWPARRPGPAAGPRRPRARARCGRRSRPARSRPAPGRRRRGARPSSRCVRRSDSATSSRAVGITSWAAGSVNMKPTRRRTSRPSRATSRPSTSTRPVVAATSPLTSRARVDLPEPLGPISATRRSVSVERRLVEDLALAVVGRDRDGDLLEADLAHAAGVPSGCSLGGGGCGRATSMSGNARWTAVATSAIATFLSTSPIQKTLSMSKAWRPRQVGAQHQAGHAEGVDEERRAHQAGARRSRGTLASERRGSRSTMPPQRAAASGKPSR